MGQYFTIYIIAAAVGWRGGEAEMARRGVVVGGGNTAAGEGMTGAGGTGGAGRWDASAAVLARLVQV